MKQSCSLAESNHQSYNFPVIVAILVLGSCIGIMSTDIYTPSLPYLSDYFTTSEDRVKLSISLNILMLGVGQLILGPLSDYYGRRPVLLYSLCLFIIFTFACAFTETIEQLIIVRMLEGFVAAGHGVIGFAIYKDLFNEKQQVKAIAISGMAVSIAPALAPIIGGYIHITLGWQYNFYIVGIAALIFAFLIFRLLPESTVPDKNSLQLEMLKTNCWRLIKNKFFLIYAAIAGVGEGVIFIFAAGAPFVFIKTLNVPIEHFGYFQAVTVFAYFIGSILSTRLIEYKTYSYILNIGVAFIVIGGIYLTTTIFFDNITKLNILFAFSLMTFGVAPLFAIAYPKALQASHNSAPAGLAASVLGAIEMIVAGSLTMLLSLFSDDSIRSLAYTVIILTAIIIILWFIVKAEN